ncbi:MAG: helix-turn-helix domain-containing protein [Ruminococcaceae bacterium]|nr:helix-turn-helix domain-containing protein [Oscillospiraceae bacterium]
MQYTYNLDNSCETIYIENLSCKDAKNTMKQSHYHDFYELYFYMGDAMTYYIGGCAYAVEKYDLIFINRGALHRTSYHNGMKERTLVMFRPEFFKILKDLAPVYAVLQTLSKTPVLRFRSDIKERLRIAFAELSALYHADTEHGFSLQIQLLHLLHAVQQYIDSGFLLGVSEAPPKKTFAVPDIIAYINTRYHEPLSLDLLASRFFIDKYYLCHAFKRITGDTVTGYLNKKRLTEAKKLLLSADYPISEIFQLVGFQSQNYFNARFKEMYGKTPSEIRRQRRA